MVSLTALTAVFAVEPVETREDFLLALQAAKPGDTIYVGDIEFQPSPFGIIVLNKSVSIAGAKPDGTNAVFKDATFAVSGSAGKVEISISGVDFRGRAADETGDPDNMPDLSNPLKTQCAAFFSGFDDWFLPSKDELNLMFVNLCKEDIGDFDEDSYWASSETDFSSEYAWRQQFYGVGQQSYGTRDYAHRMRPVRAF